MIDTTVIMYDEFTGTGGGGVDFLLGNVSDKIQAVVTIGVHWESEVDMITVTGLNTITRNDFNGSFITDGFQVGDTFVPVAMGANSGNTYTISTITTKVIVTTGAMAANGVFTTAEIHGTTPVTSLDYFYNLIEKDGAENFTSMVDSPNQMKYSITGAGSMTPQGLSKGWVFLYPYLPVVVSLGTSNYIQSFSITHNFIIVPLALAGDFQNIEDIKPPNYFIGTKCLKYINKVNAKFAANDPCIVHTETTADCSGNTGWFDEMFNGGSPNYSKTSITYSDDASGDPVTALQYCRKTNVEATIEATSSLFGAGMDVVLSFFWLPTDSSVYKNTSTNFIQNFRFDRKLFQSDAVAVNGDNYGTPQQVLTGITGYALLGNYLTVYFSVDLSSAFNTYLDGTSMRDYVLEVSVQDPTITTTIGSDRVTVRLDANSFICDKREEDFSGMM